MISRPWRITWFLFFCAGLNYADRTALSSVIPPLRESIGITDAQIGLAGMLFLWSYAIASPFVGNIADYFSRAKIVTFSLVGWSVVTILTGLSPNVTVLLGLRVLLGFAESFYLPAAVALLGAEHGPATRGKAMGLHLLGLNLGMIAGGAAAGLMAEHYGWRLGFWVLGGLGIVLAAFSTFFLREKPTDAVEPKVPAPSKTVALEAWAYCMRVPSFYCMLASAMAAGVASWIFLSWLPLFFAENYGMALGAAGLTGVALYKMPVFAGIALGGWLSDKVALRNHQGRALIKGLSFIASAPFLFLFIGSPTFIVVAVAMVVSSLIRAIGLPSEHPLLCEVIPPDYRATAVGIFNTCGTAAGGLGVLLAGIFKKDLGLNLIFGASSFIYVLAGLLMLLAYRAFMTRDMERARLHEAATVSPSVA